MLINYGSAAYFIPFVITAGVGCALYFPLRRRSPSVKKLAVLILMAVNILQHVLKQFVWPHYWGNSYPDLINGAYNMCSVLIIISPFVLLSKSRALKQFITYVGTAAGLATFIVPYWYIGQTFFQWDVLRYYFCHGLLILTSLLPAVWGLYKFCWRDFYKFPFIFFALLILIIFNDFLFYSFGIIGEGEDFFTVLYNNNPCWMMHPNEGFGFLIPVIDAFTPDIFFTGANGGYVPVLWYAIPMFLLICVLGIILGILFDFIGFSRDMSSIARRVRVLFVPRTKFRRRAPRFRCGRRRFKKGE